MAKMLADQVIWISPGCPWRKPLVIIIMINLVASRTNAVHKFWLLSIMADLAPTQVSSRTASEAVVITGLKELAALLLQLREVAIGARDVLLQGEKPLLVLVEHPARAVRLAACQCLWTLALAFPPQLAGLLNTCLNRVRAEHAKLSGVPAKSTDTTHAVLHAHAHAVAALVGAIRQTPHGAPNDLISSTLSAACDLAASGGESREKFGL